MLCLTEKHHIIFPTNNLLNKPNELVLSVDMTISSILQITKTYHHNFSQIDYKIYFQQIVLQFKCKTISNNIKSFK